MNRHVEHRGIGQDRRPPHTSGGALMRDVWPDTVEALMRSRFEAFRDGDAEWLLASWHPDTRPTELNLDPDQHWRGLQIVDVQTGDPDDSGGPAEHGIVEFRATCSVRGRMWVLRERSRFSRLDGRWLYRGAETEPSFEPL